MSCPPSFSTFYRELYSSPVCTRAEERRAGCRGGKGGWSGPADIWTEPKRRKETRQRISSHVSNHHWLRGKCVAWTDHTWQRPRSRPAPSSPRQANLSLPPEKRRVRRICCAAVTRWCRRPRGYGRRLSKNKQDKGPQGSCREAGGLAGRQGLLPQSGS